MAEKTGIAWTDHTFYPWMGCQRVSPGCEHCYAETLTTNRMGLKLWGPASTTKRQRTKGPWAELPRWNAAAAKDGVRRRVFCASLADLFEDHPDVAPWRADALALLDRCTNLDVQLLTKRPENILAMVPDHWRTAWPAHVWIGTTVEDQRRAEERIPHLLAVPARVRFLSVEPMLEPVDLAPWLFVDGEDDWCGCGRGARAIIGNGFHRCAACGVTEPAEGSALSWVIVGGESGPGARPFDLAWARSIVAQCREAGVPVFVKQFGARPVETSEECPAGGGCGLDECAMGCHYRRAETRRWPTRDRAGADPAEWPEDLRVQQFPGVSP